MMEEEYDFDDSNDFESGVSESNVEQEEIAYEQEKRSDLSLSTI